MKIVKLEVENFKRLVALSITPTGEVVEIGGKNGQGKSSVLDAIWVALAGMSVSPKKPIRTGAEQARIRLDLGEIIVTRTFKHKGDGEITSKITVEKADGSSYSSPQSMLDKLFDALALDPLAFERMDDKAKFDAMRRFVPDVDFDGIAAAQRGDFERRAALNRKAKDARASAGLQKFDPQYAVAAMPDEAALVAKLDEAGKHNTGIEARKANRQRVKEKVAGIRQWISENEIGIAVLNKQIEEAHAKIDALRKSNLERDRDATREEERLAAAPPLPLPIDTSEIMTKIESARAEIFLVVEHSRRKAEQEALIAAAQEFERQAEDLSIAMDNREIKKREAIAAAKLPVDGLSFGDGELLFNNEPFSQASDAERLRVSIAMAMAMNSKLRIIRVRDGSLMDDDSMRLLADMAKAHDFQVWVERVGGGKGVGFVLEDGHLKTEGSTAA